VLASLVGEAGRQYRHRPLAAVATVTVGLASLWLQRAPQPVQVVGGVGLVVVGVLAELFLIAYLAEALQPGPHQPGRALAAARRSAGPGLRGALLQLLYVALAYTVALLLLGGRDPATLSQGEQTAFEVGTVPLLAVAYAFLAVLGQRIVLDGERRARQAAAVSHRVAVAHFPICLGIGLLQGLGWVAGTPRIALAGQVAIALGLGLVEPFRIAMSNALFLATRPLHAGQPDRQGDPDRRA
jgi:hypothetical protein